MVMMMMQHLEVGGQVWSKNFPPQWQLARQIELLMELLSHIHKVKQIFVMAEIGDIVYDC